MLKFQQNIRIKVALFILLGNFYWHLTYIAFGLLATILENFEAMYIPYTIISLVAAIIFYTTPLASTMFNLASIVFQILALRNCESKVKHIVLVMVLTVFLEVVAVLFGYYINANFQLTV